MEKRTQLNVDAENVPGKLAEVCGALAKAGVSIEGLCCTESGSHSTMHFVLDNVEAGKKVLGAFKGFSMSEILLYDCPADKPGVIAALTKACSDAGVNIKNVYSASSGKGQPAKVFLFVEQNDLEKAIKVCAGI